MNHFEKLFELSATTTVALAIRYAFFAGLAWILGYWLCRNRWFHRKIVQRFPASAEVRREMAYSASSVLIFGIVGAITVLATRAGWTKLYWRIDQHGWMWFGLSIICAIILHDTYFYWTHRLMHHRKLFRVFHRTHHLSRNPTPWAAYAFSPAEAVIQAGIFPLTVLLMPMHPFAFAIFMLWQISYNVIGHTGYEVYPNWLMRSWLGKIANTPTNHAMHHETMRGNFGLYYNVWDRLMRTNHEGYEDRFHEVTSREKRAERLEHIESEEPFRGDVSPSET